MGLHILTDQRTDPYSCFILRFMDDSGSKAANETVEKIFVFHNMGKQSFLGSLILLTNFRAQ